MFKVFLNRGEFAQPCSGKTLGGTDPPPTGTRVSQWSPPFWNSAAPPKPNGALIQPPPPQSTPPQRPSVCNINTRLWSVRLCHRTPGALARGSEFGNYSNLAKNIFRRDGAQCGVPDASCGFSVTLRHGPKAQGLGRSPVCSTPTNLCPPTM